MIRQRQVSDMTELLILIPICILSVPMLIAIPYNCIRAKGKNRRIVHIGNSVLLLAFLGIIAARITYNASIKIGSGDNDFIVMDCIKDNDGYYWLYESSGGSRPNPSRAVVPAERVENGSYFEYGGDAFIYVEKDKQVDDGSTYISLNGREYLVSDTVKKVMPGYHELFFGISCTVWLAMFIFNFAEFFIVMYSGAKRKKNEYYNDFI